MHDNNDNDWVLFLLQKRIKDVSTDVRDFDIVLLCHQSGQHREKHTAAQTEYQSVSPYALPGFAHDEGDVTQNIFFQRIA